MQNQSIESYCLFCKTNQDDKVVSFLEKKGYTAISPKAERWMTGEKKTVIKMLPGYVFFESTTQPAWTSVIAEPAVLKVLQYDDGNRALKGDDLAFWCWLKQYDGFIRMSNAIQVGTKIEFVDGPLRDMTGSITAVNKKRRQVQVSTGNGALITSRIWCSINIIRPVTIDNGKGL